MSAHTYRKRLSFVSMVSQFSISMVNFALVYFLREKGFSSSEIGIAASIYPLMYLVFCIIFAKTLSSRSLKGKIALSYIGMLFSVAMIILSPNKAVSYISLVLYGISMALLWPNMETWITKGAEGDELNASVSSFNFAWSFGAGISTLLGGILSERSSSLPLYLSIALFLALTLTIATTRGGGSDKESAEEKKPDQSTPLRYFSWIGILLLYSGYSLIINIFPLYALEQLGFSESLTGMLLLFRGITACIAFVLLGRVSFWQFSKSSIIASQSLYILLILLMGSITSPALFSLFFIAFGVDFSLIYLLSIFHGASGAADREKRMMVHEVLLTVGTVIGSLFGGIIYEKFTFQNVLNMIFIVSFATLVVEIPLMRRTGRAVIQKNR